jgi:hypothetical protein
VAADDWRRRLLSQVLRVGRSSDADLGGMDQLQRGAHLPVRAAPGELGSERPEVDAVSVAKGPPMRCCSSWCRRHRLTPKMSYGRWPLPALAAERRWTKSTLKARQPGTQQLCDLTQRRRRGQIFCKLCRSPILGRFKRSGARRQRTNAGVPRRRALACDAADQASDLKFWKLRQAGRCTRALG